MAIEIFMTPDAMDVSPLLYKYRGIDLVTLDVENVITDYGDPQVRPKAAQHIGDLLMNGIQVSLITNNKNFVPQDDPYSSPMQYGFVDKVLAQLNNLEVGDVKAFYPTMPGQPLKKKPSADMFTAAAKDAGVDPARAAHVDDQPKAYFGARCAGYKMFVWPKPYGEHQHGGVKLMRPFEEIVRTGLQLKEYVMTGFLPHE